MLVINGSDVRVENDYLRDAVAPFIDPKGGAVTAFFRGMTEGGFASDVDAIGVPTDSSASTLVARKLGQIDIALGWTMAITRKRLAEIGGFESMVNLHSDDFMLGNEVTKRSYRMELMRKAVWMVFPNQTLVEFFKHELRWSINLKNLRPSGFLSLFMTFGIAWSLLVALIVPSWKVAVAYALVYRAMRLSEAWVISVKVIGNPIVRRKFWLVPVRDALNLCVYLASFFSNTIHWRGLPYRVQGASMIPIDVIPAVAIPSVGQLSIAGPAQKE